MTTKLHADIGVTGSTPERRKEELLAQGRIYRARIIAARAEASQGMSAEALTKSALNHAIHLAYTGLNRMAASKGLSVSSLMPMVIGGVSFLGKRALLKPVLKGGLVITAAVFLGRYFLRRKKKDLQLPG